MEGFFIDWVVFGSDNMEVTIVLGPIRKRVIPHSLASVKKAEKLLSL